MVLFRKRFIADREPPREEAPLPPAAANPLVPEAPANGTDVADRGAGAAILAVAGPVTAVLVWMVLDLLVEAAVVVELPAVNDVA